MFQPYQGCLVFLLYQPFSHFLHLGQLQFFQFFRSFADLLNQVHLLKALQFVQILLPLRLVFQLIQLFLHLKIQHILQFLYKFSPYYSPQLFSSINFSYFLSKFSKYFSLRICAILLLISWSDFTQYSSSMPTALLSNSSPLLSRSVSIITFFSVFTFSQLNLRLPDIVNTFWLPILINASLSFFPSTKTAFCLISSSILFTSLIIDCTDSFFDFFFITYYLNYFVSTLKSPEYHYFSF